MGRSSTAGSGETGAPRSDVDASNRKGCMMTKRQARLMAEIKRAEGCAYQLPEDGLAPIGSAQDVPGSVQRITVDAEGFWRAVMDVNATNAPKPKRYPTTWDLADAIAKDRADRAARDCEDGLIRGEDEPGEDELINR